MDFMPCQLAASASVLPSGSNWVFEPKYDGYRCQLLLRAGKLQLFTRNGLDWTDRLGRSLPAEIAAHHNCVLDGEICALDPEGRPDFGLLCQALSDRSIPLTFFAFDLIAIQGVSLTALPFIERKQRLSDVLCELSIANINFVAHAADGIALSQTLRAARWEGVMAKEVRAPYVPGGRSPAWRKVKFTRRQEFIVAGWRPDPATGDVKSIVLATVEGSKVTLRGSVGSGFSATERKRLPALFSRLALTDSANPAHTKRERVYYLRPELVAEIEFLELSSKGCVRGPSFLGLREDKRAAEVCLESGAS